MNIVSGAWCKFTGWDANSFASFQDELYYGGKNGCVYKCDTGEQDEKIVPFSIADVDFKGSGLNDLTILRMSADDWSPSDKTLLVEIKIDAAGTPDEIIWRYTPSDTGIPSGWSDSIVISSGEMSSTR